MIVIIDFGSQYNQLIARRVRENHVFCQIEPPGIPLATLKALQPEGIILSGGPSSIYEAGSPKVDPGIFTLDGTGTGQAVAINPDGTFNSATNPAARGSIVTFFATGVGFVEPPIEDGRHPPAPVYPRPAALPEIRLGGRPLAATDIGFAGLVWAGVFQFNIRIPTDIPPSQSAELLLRTPVRVNQIPTSRSGVTLAVK
jgi:uncharacterized protein (TIGR03437 family)